MTIADLLDRLDCVRPRGTGRWSARCAAHVDRSPSLSVTEGQRGILLRCWAGCTLDEICAALGIRPKDLFYDRRPDPAALAEARQRRTERERSDRVAGCHASSLRDAGHVIRSARDLDISSWNDAQLNRAFDRLATAHAVLSKQGADYYEWLARL